jgi:hypothetical protein
MTTPTTDAPTGGLRAARKEHAAARRAAKPAPAKAPAKKAAAKKAAAKAAGPRLAWQFSQGFEERGKTGQTATSGDREYALKPTADGKWRATVKQGGKTTVLAEGGKGAAYTAIVKHNQGAAK